MMTSRLHGIIFYSKRGNKYFYDNKTGFIFPIGNGNFDYDKFQHKYHDKLGIQRDFDNIIDNITALSVEDYLVKNANGFKQLILEVTSRCNFRCSYCCYSNHYSMNRSHRSSDMTWETARKAIEYYMKNFKVVAKRNPLILPTVGFYGGEPLLNFGVVKEIVNYLKTNYEKFRFNFNITINGSLFTEGIQDFLVKNDFSILLSLDGDRETHNRNRVKIDRISTFDKIMNNIDLFRENYPNYCKFGISGCYNLKTNFSDVEKFFTDERLFVVTYNQIDPNNTSYYSCFKTKDFSRFEYLYNKFESKFARYVEEQGKYSDIKDFLYSMIGRKYLNSSYHSVLKGCRSYISPFTGTCIPGEKLYVSINGDIHICEKINHNHPIGDVDRGLNYQYIADLINKYNVSVCVKCESCSVQKYCSLCLAKCATNTDFCKAQNYCDNFEKSISIMLHKFVSLLENNPEIFKRITINYYTNILDTVGEQF